MFVCYGQVVPRNFRVKLLRNKNKKAAFFLSVSEFLYGACKGFSKFLDVIVLTCRWCVIRQEAQLSPRDRAMRRVT